MLFALLARSVNMVGILYVQDLRNFLPIKSHFAYQLFESLIFAFGPGNIDNSDGTEGEELAFAGGCGSGG